MTISDDFGSPNPGFRIDEGGAHAPETGEGGSGGRGEPGTPSAVGVLMTRSRLAQAMRELPRLRSVLILEDDKRDSDRLVSTLRSIFGYDLSVRQCETLGTALDALTVEQPDLVFLDDRLGPVDRAERSVPFLRTAGCVATIVVISSHVDRRRRADLLRLDVGDVIAKDDLDSTSICQALLDAEARRQAKAQADEAAPPQR